MPEGDTIFRTARALGRALQGSRVTGFHSEFAPLARVQDQTPLTDRTVEQVESRGKWLLIHFSGAATGSIAENECAEKESDADTTADPASLILATHMRMPGSWYIYRPGERWRLPRSNMRIVIETQRYEAVAFLVPVARFYTPRALARESSIPPIHADLLHPAFDPAAAALRLLARTEDELAVALLRQQILAGVGNVFKSEICFLARIHPFEPVANLSAAQAAQLVAIAQKLLRANVLEDSGERIVTYRGSNRRTTQSADPGANLWVYHRAGQPCRVCGRPIQRALQGAEARSTYWCPGCQPRVDGLG